MWELDYKESWVPKNWCCWTVVLEKTLESGLDWKKIQPIHPKGNQSWILIGRTDAEAEIPIFWPFDMKKWLFWRTLMLGKLELLSFTSPVDHGLSELSIVTRVKIPTIASLVIYVCVCVCVCCHVWLFVTPQTIVYQAPLSMGFPRQEYWSGFPFPTPGEFPGQGIEP